MTTKTIEIIQYTCNTCKETIMKTSKDKIDPEWEWGVKDTSKYSPDNEPKLTFAGYQTPTQSGNTCTNQEWIHFCSDACKGEFAEKRHVIQFDILY
jgi:hypothetical protein